MGQVYYGNYMRWFEIGRAEWFRGRGTSYRELESEGVFLPVIEAHCRYHKPAFYDDILLIATRFHFTGARLRFDYRIERQNNGDFVAEGYTVHVCVDRQRKVLKPSKSLRNLLLTETGGDSGSGFDPEPSIQKTRLNRCLSDSEPD